MEMGRTNPLGFMVNTFITITNMFVFFFSDFVYTICIFINVIGPRNNVDKYARMHRHQHRPYSRGGMNHMIKHHIGGAIAT